VSDSTLRLRKTAEAVQSIDRTQLVRFNVPKDDPWMAADPEPDGDEGDEDPLAVPPSWTKGQLLNVRNRGEFYVITLLGEEDEPPLKPAPNGALRFTNTALCQDFVSRWYASEHHDPRAR
jgi:hypothetical protein